MDRAAWAETVSQYDLSIVVMFMGVVSFALNWNVFTGDRIRRVLLAVPIWACAVILAIEFMR